jgi:hypothetical protein
MGKTYQWKIWNAETYRNRFRIGYYKSLTTSVCTRLKCLNGLYKKPPIGYTGSVSWRSTQQLFTSDWLVNHLENVRRGDAIIAKNTNYALFRPTELFIAFYSFLGYAHARLFSLVKQ